MSQITAPLSINNGAATPVAKSFAPESVAPGLSVFTERSAAVSAGFYRLSVGFSPATANRKTNRVTLELALPGLQSVNGIYSVAYTGRFKGEFILPDTMTNAERWDLHAFVANALDDAKLKAIVRDLDPLY